MLYYGIRFEHGLCCITGYVLNMVCVYHGIRFEHGLCCITGNALNMVCVVLRDTF